MPRPGPPCRYPRSITNPVSPARSGTGASSRPLIFPPIAPSNSRDSAETASGDPCTRTIRVYMDGRSRFDFVLTPNGRVNVNTAAYQGEALRCR